MSSINSATGFVALGGNLGNVLQTFNEAVARMRQEQLDVVAFSSAYRTEALTLAHQKQQNISCYWNSVIEIRTTCSARAVLDKLLAIETKLGRVRSHRWASRCLDLDILLFSQEEVYERDLEIPHPRMLERLFVMYPLMEIAPDWLLPSGICVKEAYYSSSFREEEILEKRVEWLYDAQGQEDGPFSS